MYQNSMSGMPLRADPTQLTVPIVMIQVGQPTFIPNMAIPQGLQPYARHIVSMVQIEIESKAGQSPLRIHAHNLLATNGFQSADFAELLDITFGYINYVMMATNQFTDIQSCMAAVIPHVVGAWSAAQVRHFPQLMQYLNPQQQQVAQSAIGTIQQIVNDVMRSRQGAFQNNYQQQGYAQPSYPPQQQYPPQFNQAQQFSPPQQFAVNQPNGNSGLFVNPRTTGFVQEESAQAPIQANQSSQRMRDQLMRQNGIDPATGQPFKTVEPSIESNTNPNPYHKAYKDDHLKRQLENQLAQMQEQKPPKVEEEKTNKNDLESWIDDCPWPEIVKDIKLKEVQVEAVKEKEFIFHQTQEEVSEKEWKASMLQPYHPAWSPSKHKVVYSKLADGSVIAVITNKSKGDKNMEYDAHAIGVRPTQHSGFTKEGETVVKNRVDEIDTIEYAQSNIEFISNDDMMVEISDKAPAVSSGIIGVMAGYIKNKNQALHTTTIIAEPVFAESHEVASYLTSLVKRASECVTFSQLCGVMKEMTSPDEMSLRYRINQLMTKAINDILVANISSNFYMDNFETDNKGLFGETKSGKKPLNDRVCEVIEKEQIRIIKSTLGVIDDKSAESMNESMKSAAPDIVEWRGCLAFISSKVTHTHLQYFAAELDIAFPRRKTSLLSEEYTPVLFHVAQEIFETEAKEKNPTARHFIITKEGMILQVQKGLINPKAYLIHIVD